MKTMRIIAKATGIIAAAVLGLSAMGANSALAGPGDMEIDPGFEMPCRTVVDCIEPLVPGDDGVPPIEVVPTDTPTATPTDEPTATPTATATEEPPTPTATATEEPPATDEPPVTQTEEPPQPAANTPQSQVAGSGSLPSAGSGDGAEGGTNWAGLALAGLVVAGLGGGLLLVVLGRGRKERLG